jgi:outer membrane lipoprotein-sorting protein
MNQDAVFSLLLLVAVTAACSWFGSTEPSPSNPSSNANTTANTGTTTTTREDPAADIDAMADKFLAQKSFRATILSTGDKDVRQEVEFVAPNRFRSKTGPGLETIVVGKDVYVSLEGSFMKLPGEMPSTVPTLREAFEKEGRKWFSDVRFVGEETVNGRPSYAYDYVNKGPQNAGEDNSKIWVAKDDGLPLRIESRYKSGNLKTMTIEYEYDPNIKIEVPKTK